MAKKPDMPPANGGRGMMMTDEEMRRMRDEQHGPRANNMPMRPADMPMMGNKGKGKGK